MILTLAPVLSMAWVRCAGRSLGEAGSRRVVLNRCLVANAFADKEAAGDCLILYAGARLASVLGT